MSGIVGIVQTSGAPVDQHLLRHLTDALAFRGPVATVDCTAHVGFGRADTSSERDRSTSLGNHLWIVADARIDGQADLRRALKSAGCKDVECASDEQLILHAYETWDTDCVQHLVGDYAFAVWDHEKQRLFCARDHFGVKPFYYSLIPDGIIFSNTLDCLRRHPRVAATLDDESIADFLLLGSNTNWATTAFAAVKRIPPAHTMTFGRDHLRLLRYWDVPSPQSVRYDRAGEYVERFLELLEQAVDDRTRTDRIGIWLSGGLDSAALAAIANGQSRRDGASRTVVAEAVVYDTLVPDDTRQYASLAAAALGIQLACFQADRHQPFASFGEPQNRTPEPNNDPFTDMRRQLLREANGRCRVWLCGEGADEILWPSRVADLLPSMRFVDLASDVARTVVSHRIRPGVGLRAMAGLQPSHEPAPPLPSWLPAELVARCDLAAKWEHAWTGSRAVHDAGSQPRDSAAHRLATTAWPWYFESFDPGTTGIDVDTRYPFLDIRLVEYMMSVPPLPWCVDKRLLRVAMHDWLPAELVNRPKTPLGGDPLRALLPLSEISRITKADSAPGIERFVDVRVLADCSTSPAADDVWAIARALSLNYWLKYHVRHGF